GLFVDSYVREKMDEAGYTTGPGTGRGCCHSSRAPGEIGGRVYAVGKGCPSAFGQSYLPREKDHETCTVGASCLWTRLILWATGAPSGSGLGCCLHATMDGRSAGCAGRTRSVWFKQ